MHPYDRVLAQLRRDPAELTDDDLATIEKHNPQIASMASMARDRHRRGEAYQQKIAAAERDQAYADDVRRRQFLDTLNQREACFRGMGEPPRPQAPKPGGRVVRLDPRFRR
jgi:hypothetical protein